MNNPGTVLFDALRRQLITALYNAASDALPAVSNLAVDEDFADTPYEGRVLARLDADHPVFDALGPLTVDQPPDTAALHGWRDTANDPASALGVAYVATTGGAAMVVLSVVPAHGPRLTLHASGLSGTLLQSPLRSGFALTISGSTEDAVEIGFTPDQPPVPTSLHEGARVELGLIRADPGELFGPATGPSVLFGSLDMGLWAGGDSRGGFDGGGHLTLNGGEVVLMPDFLTSLVPVQTHFPLQLDARVAPGRGVTLDGSPSLKVRLIGTEGHWLDVEAILADTVTPSVSVGFRTSVSATLPGAPVEVAVDGLGFDLPLSLNLGTPLLPDPASMMPVLPSGIGAALDLPILTGSGMLMRLGEDLAGALSVRIPPMSVSAFGVLSPRHNDVPLSFLAILGATFPPPGVQIGFGFAITGVGGVVGVNRRIDRDALTRAVADGTAAQLLFPSDPVGAGAVAVAALPAIFPAARGSVVAGPMFQISWGGRLVELSVAVLAEVSRQVRVTIIGKLVVAVPDPMAPLIYLQATFAGFIDPAEPSVMFVASLTGSHVVGAALTGDVLVLTRGGPDATMVISAGGFHPSYRLPRGVPALARIQLDLCPTPLIQMRCNAYFALTSNTMQFGAELELVAEVAGCGLRGHFGFDALVQFSPFRFVADVSGGVALRAFGQTLMGISLAMHLEGPAPYLARGRGSIDLFLFEVSFDFEVGWGSAAGQISARDVEGDLRAALQDPAAWRSRGRTCPGVQLTRAGAKRVESGIAVDPYGTVSVDQSLVPLGIEIQEYGGIPIPPQRFDIVEGAFRYDDGTGRPVEPADHLSELRSEFAPGMYLTSNSDDEALTGEPFVLLGSGTQLFPQPATGSESRAVDFVWEERVRARDIPRPIPASIGMSTDVMLIEEFTLTLSIEEPRWWQSPEEPVVVATQPPVAVVTSWSMTEDQMVAPTMLEATQAVTAGDLSLMTVEQWEL